MQWMLWCNVYILELFGYSIYIRETRKYKLLNSSILHDVIYKSQFRTGEKLLCAEGILLLYNYYKRPGALMVISSPHIEPSKEAFYPV